MSWKININGTFFITIIFVLVALILSTVLFSSNEDYSDLFIVKDGVLNLSPEDLSYNIPLIGQWHFYNQELLGAGGEKVHEPSIVEVPHVWEEKGGTGFGTYKLRVTGLEPDETYSLYLYDMVTAYELFVDNELIAHNGTIGKDIEEERLEWRPLIADFSTESGDVEIAIQLSNYHYFPGGLWREIKIGKKGNIAVERESNIISQMVMFGGILMIGIYNLSLFLLNSKERAALYFSIFNFMVAFRIPLTGERIINNWLDNPDWILLTQIQYLLGYSMLGLFILFLYKLFESDFRRLLVLICVGVVTLLNITVFIFPLKQFKIFDNIYGGVAVLFLSYILLVLIRAIKNKSHGSVFSFIGLAFVLVATLLDMVLPPGSNVIPIGIFIFMLFQSLVIAEKYSFISSENEFLHHTATRDGMTSLFKKEHFVKLISKFLECSYVGVHHSVLFIDIDDFKVINDTYGHDVGDEFIVTISERIIRSLRNTDVACRYGGDEFLVWIDNMTPEDVRIIAERLLENISEPIMLQDTEIIVSVSMGISMYPEDGTDAESLITKSDERMYQAKSKGKNQYMMGKRAESGN